MFLLASGSTVTSTLAGCTGTSDDRSSVPVPPNDADPLEYVSVEDHQLTVRWVSTSCGDGVGESEEDTIKQVRVTGTITNPTGRPLEYVSVEATVYDATGTRLGTYSDETNGLAADATREFDVLVLEDAGEVREHDLELVDASW
ncbi:carboxypeptidase regulatory-like domain-containing protein [Natronobacterium gregoryi SP2]|uniref:Carboxypeptidase regulatory-like domain-containing protein n=1 Tax=Natronobacterium gregoryi (strain ATCC 43098 / DSM 3393 / CCM 3738 / CIP 104747 / IAM 13177 / JCM 8860 / NBRC 102187 / NCIMB 2189 / SP2) TaxID=797304 RepID=L9XKP2_NATGS|nr:hypothetical protein C490_18198 [Natronobacterium gregoryi SP2]PLK18662.1 carboxypeptidase regulatory-like domain-containing protein [Natronobacterium gregoryi SP2]